MNENLQNPRQIRGLEIAKRYTIKKENGLYVAGRLIKMLLALGLQTDTISVFKKIACFVVPRQLNFRQPFQVRTQNNEKNTLAFYKTGCSPQRY